MAFIKGISGNVKGRKSGAKNKVHTDIKEAFQSLIESNLSNIETWLNEVASKDPAKALDMLLRLSEFILPKMKATELTGVKATGLKQVMIINGKEIEF
jgi:DNA phosphorothioation-dependent restriction protein DptG